MKDTKREAFEAWAGEAGYCTHRDESDKYLDYHRATTRFAWEGWCAALSIASQEATAPRGTISEEQCDWSGWIDELCAVLLPIAHQPGELGQRAEGLGQFIPALRNVFEKRRDRAILAEASPLPTAPTASKPMPDYCPEKLKPGGCQLHNLHCGYPKCNQPPEQAK